MRLFIVTFLVVVGLGGDLHAQTGVWKSPKLGVVVVVDQLRGDEIEKHRALWTGGFKRLVSEGRWYSNAWHAHTRTETAAGHASVGTGMTPRHHGVVDKRLYDRKLKKAVKLCRIGNEPCSPSVLLVPTIGDRLKMSSPKSQVIAMSQKGRAAALLGGKRADIVSWFDRVEPRLRGRSNAGQGPVPGWLNDAFMGMAAHDKVVAEWVLPKLPEIYAQLEDERAGERGCGHGVVFPHRLPDMAHPEARWKAWWCTPDADRKLERLVELVIDKARLGKDGVPDLLLVSFGATDQVGHAFGPESVERVAMLKTLDGIIGNLMAKIEEVTGGDAVLILTSDHGVTPVLPHLQKMGLKGGRVDMKALKKFVERGLRRKLGRRRSYVEAISFPYLFLSSDLDDPMRRKAAIAAAEILRTHPQLARAWPTADLRSDSDDPIERTVYANSHPDVSGEVAMVLNEYFTRKRVYYGPLGAQHGSPWRDDRHVPVLFWGRGVKPGKVETEVLVIDAMRSFTDRLGIPVDTRGGRPLPI